MNLLETRIEIKKGGDGTKVRDPSENSRGVEVIIELGIVVKGHAFSKALSERSKNDAGIKPESEPPFVFLHKRVPGFADETRWLVISAQLGFELVPSVARD